MAQPALKCKSGRRVAPLTHPAFDASPMCMGEVGEGSIGPDRPWRRGAQKATLPDLRGLGFTPGSHPHSSVSA